MMGQIRFHVLLTLVLASMVPIGVPAQQTFEGIVESKNTTTDERGTLQQFTMTMYVRKDMLKIHNSPTASSPGSLAIYRGDKNLVWMLDDEDKSYCEIRRDERPEEFHSSFPSQKKGPILRRTGKKSEILGYACEHFVLVSDDVETEIWATKSLGYMYAVISGVLGEEGGASGAVWEQNIQKMGYYPLTASTKVSGNILESQQVTRIEKKSLPPGLFEVPPEYKKRVAGEVVR